MGNETGRIPSWRPVAMVAALGVAVLAGTGLGIADSPHPIAAYDPIERPCLPPPSVDTGPGQDVRAPNLNVLVADMHETPLFTTDQQYSYMGTESIGAKAERKFQARIHQIRGGTPDGEIPPNFGQKQLNEINEAANQLNIDTEKANAGFLASRGIRVLEPISNRAKRIAVNEGVGPNAQVLQALAYIPRAIVTASGLREVVISGNAPDGVIALDMPEAKNGVLTVGYSDQIPYGLSEMVLNNCPDRQAILDSFRALNDNTSNNYGANPAPKYNDAWQRRYGDVFNSPAAMTSPEVEFIELFTNAMQGQNQYDDTKRVTILGWKQQIAQSVFDRFVPDGKNYEAFGYFARSYGNPDNYSPNQLASVLFNLVVSINQAKTPQAKISIMEQWNAQFG